MKSSHSICVICVLFAEPYRAQQRQWKPRVVMTYNAGCTSGNYVFAERTVLTLFIIIYPAVKVSSLSLIHNK